MRGYPRNADLLGCHNLPEICNESGLPVHPEPLHRAPEALLCDNEGLRCDMPQDRCYMELVIRDIEGMTCYMREDCRYNGVDRCNDSLLPCDKEELPRMESREGRYKEAVTCYKEDEPTTRQRSICGEAGVNRDIERELRYIIGDIRAPGAFFRARDRVARSWPGRPAGA